MRSIARAGAAAWLLATSCTDEPQGREETGLESLGFDDVNPKVIVPGTVLTVEGRSFLDDPLGLSWLRLAGTYGGAPIDAFVPAAFVDFTHLEVVATPSVLGLLGSSPQTFSGQVQVNVDFVPTGTRFATVERFFELQFREHLQPRLDAVEANAVIFVNEPMVVVGEGMLLGGDEGSTFAVVEGCFRPLGADACDPVDRVEVRVTAAEPFSRERGVFPFSPHIAGIRAGSFEGTVRLRNDHADGEVIVSEPQAIAYDLAESTVAWVGNEDGEGVGSLGRFVDVAGAGFVSRDDGGLTTLVFDGSYLPESGGEVEVPPLQLIPEYVDGRRLRYVVNEDPQDALAQALGDVRMASGLFVGQVHPVVEHLDDRVEGAPTPISLRIEPVRQVVYVQFRPTYVESLRAFGLRAADEAIRERVFEVLRRDYEAINVEFRDEPPTDYKLFAVVEISGPDPQGQGLLGYDNTPGKDVDNERLDDRIGGVNAQTLESGLPGYGGVFMDSLFSFSLHPPPGAVNPSGLASPVFDEIFDPLRPDRGGRPVTSADLVAGVPAVDSGAACPGGNRAGDIACAVFVLGSVVGSTTSHELGHSLGLAEPRGSLTDFHNGGDLPDRLMDAGTSRTFEERAELMGQGPSRFCVESFEYLREILPTNEPDPPVSRPPC
ncbi:MAG: hypothetical protein AB1Z98_37525 [Nannocystaceae bacterium]